MNLGAPTQLFFWISLVIVIIGILMALGIITFIPIAAVWVVTIGYIVLVIGCMMRGA
ncbi:MAG TPA: hypothetical protein VMF90_04940 [Rhizobiaceae bacterium]|nr:hypothetical protein [Rhizobiaceae bacterium]